MTVQQMRAVELDVVALADGVAAAPVWIQIAKVGQWAGHPSGPFKLSGACFEEIVRNFRATQNKRVAIDFEHASEMDPAEGSIPKDGAPAQGWILDLDNRGGQGLWALVEWLEPARSYIKQGKYKYFSPAIRFGAKDRVTGEKIGCRLTSGALTNQPFLDGMQQVAASDRTDEEGSDTLSLFGDYVHGAHEFMPAIKTALRLPDLATPKEVHAHIARLEEHHTAANGASHVHGVAVGDYMRDLSSAMRMPMGTRADEMFKTAKRLVRSAMKEPPAESSAAVTATAHDDVITASDKQEEPNMDQAKLLSDANAKVSELTLKLSASEAESQALKTENKALKDKVEAIETKALEAEVDEAIMVYADSKGLKAELRPHLLSFAKASPDAFRAMYPRVQPGQEHLQRRLADDGPANGKGATGGNVVSLSERTKELMAEKKLSFVDAQREASKEFRHVFVSKGGR